MTKWTKKKKQQNPNTCCPKARNFKYKNADRSKVKWYTNSKHKIGEATLALGTVSSWQQVLLEIKTSVIMKFLKIHQEVLTIINVPVPMSKVSKYIKQNWQN